jgi:hypothetical protein
MQRNLDLRNRIYEGHLGKQGRKSRLVGKSKVVLSFGMRKQKGKKIF